MTSAGPRRARRPATIDVAAGGSLRGTGLGSPRNGLAERRPYVYGGHLESIESIRARVYGGRVADLDPGGPDAPDELGYEHRREQLVEDGHDWEPPAHVIPRITIEAAWPPAPEPPPATPAPPAGRCEACGYLTAAIGHKVACGD